MPLFLCCFIKLLANHVFTIKSSAVTASHPPEKASLRSIFAPAKMLPFPLIQCHNSRQKQSPHLFPLSHTDGQIRKENSLPVMSRESRFDPGSDHRDGSKCGRRTPPPRLVPAQREKQLRGEGGSAQARRLRPAETAHGRGGPAAQGRFHRLTEGNSERRA